MSDIDQPLRSKIRQNPHVNITAKNFRHFEVKNRALTNQPKYDRFLTAFWRGVHTETGPITIFLQGVTEPITIFLQGVTGPVTIFILLVFAVENPNLRHEQHTYTAHAHTQNPST